MKFFHTAGALTFALALVPAFKAWPTVPSEETPAEDEEFDLLGRIEFPCGLENEEVRIRAVQKVLFLLTLLNFHLNI